MKEENCEKIIKSGTDWKEEEEEEKKWRNKSVVEKKKKRKLVANRERSLKKVFQCIALGT